METWTTFLRDPWGLTYFVAGLRGKFRAGRSRLTSSGPRAPGVAGHLTGLQSNIELSACGPRLK